MASMGLGKVESYGLTPQLAIQSMKEAVQYEAN